MPTTPQIQYPVGAHIPSTSRYKCMAEFLRPAQLFKDASGLVVAGPSPGITTCCKPKGHDGPHENCRGEVADKAATEQVGEYYRKQFIEMQEELKRMREAQAEMLKALADNEEVKDKVDE